MKPTQDSILSTFHLFFGRSYNSTILFRDKLTFRTHNFMVSYGNSSLFHGKSSIFEMQLQNYFGSAVSLLVGCPPGPSSAQPRLYTTTLAVYIGNGQKLLLFPEKYIQEITFSSVCSGNVIALKFLMVFFLPLISKPFKNSIFRNTTAFFFNLCPYKIHTLVYQHQI